MKNRTQSFSPSADLLDASISAEITLREAAARLHMTATNVLEHIRRKNLPGRKVRDAHGNWRWLVQESDVEKLDKRLRQRRGQISLEKTLQDIERERIRQNFRENAKLFISLLEGATRRVESLPEATKPLTREQVAERVVTCLEQEFLAKYPDAKPISEKEHKEWITKWLELEDGWRSLKRFRKQ